jgi:hypothetical protein
MVIGDTLYACTPKYKVADDYKTVVLRKYVLM